MNWYLVPYQQKFRGARKYEKQTYVEFAHEWCTLFDRWRLASEVQSFDQLCELVLMEQFKETLPERMAVYLIERNVKLWRNLL